MPLCQQEPGRHYVFICLSSVRLSHSWLGRYTCSITDNTIARQSAQTTSYWLAVMFYYTKSRRWWQGVLEPHCSDGWHQPWGPGGRSGCWRGTRSSSSRWRCSSSPGSRARDRTSLPLTHHWTWGWTVRQTPWHVPSSNKNQELIQFLIELNTIMKQTFASVSVVDLVTFLF